MYKVIIDKECGCFKKSGMPKTFEYEEKADAVMKAKVLECKMNQDFCFKHYFEAVDHGDEIIIHSTIRPEDDEEFDEECDVKTLLEKNPVDIFVDGTKNRDGAEINPHDDNCPFSNDMKKNK
jgi:hypothetical protein